MLPVPHWVCQRDYNPNAAYLLFLIPNIRWFAFSGAFLQFGFSAGFYSCGLTFYYLLTIRFGMTNAFMKKRVEPAIHIISVGFPFVTAVLGVALDTFHELDLGTGCW